jgi:hypothetical protein
MIMDETTRLALIRRALDVKDTDIETRHEIYHDDAVLEFPQGQERFEGRANFLAWRKIYPAKVEFKLRQIRGGGDIYVVEGMVRYNGGPWGYGFSIHEFRGDKIACETIYYGEGWEAPDWRAPWRSKWQDELVVDQQTPITEE